MPDFSSQTPHPRCFDPYLRFAIDTGFRYFQRLGDDRRIALLVQLAAGRDAQAFSRDIDRAGLPGHPEIGPTEDDAPFVSLRGEVLLVTDPRWIALWDALALQVALALPIRPTVRDPTLLRSLAYDTERPRSDAETVVGIIDDGCAFAHAAFRGVGLGTRVFAIWDQETREPIVVQTPQGPAQFGRKLQDFGYGLEFWRSDSTPPGAPLPLMGLDRWTKRFETATGNVDEDGCYARGGFRSLRRCVTHGSHVMDLFAGRIPLSSRISMDPRKPPSFEPSSDVAGRTDIVFVQIPRSAIDDASGLWLDDHVTQGLRYLISCLDLKKTKKLVVNLSYGPTTGPHDGTAMLELLMAALADFCRLVGLTLDIVLPAGNARHLEGHVAFRSTAAQPGVEWTWRVPPENTVPVFAEVWVDPAHLSSTQVELVPPHGGAGAPPIIEVPTTLVNRRWLFAVPPTSGSTPALHGDWTIRVRFAKPGARLHAYAAKTDPNMGGRAGAKSSCFVDAPWEAAHGGSAAQHPRPAPASASGSLIHEAGAFNGLATGAHARVHVAGGFEVSGRRVSRYSSIGPTRNPLRVGPDHLLPTDESPARLGVPGAGTRSGCVFRLVGTSAAAPQLARLHAEPPTPATAPVQPAAASAPPVNCPPGQQDPEVGCGPIDPP